jgi:hypothetical protein
MGNKLSERFQRQPVICDDNPPAKLPAGHAITVTIKPAASQGFVLT